MRSVLEYALVERKIGDESLELAVLFVQLTKLAKLGRKSLPFRARASYNQAPLRKSDPTARARGQKFSLIILENVIAHPKGMAIKTDLENVTSLVTV